MMADEQIIVQKHSIFYALVSERHDIVNSLFTFSDLQEFLRTQIEG